MVIHHDHNERNKVDAIRDRFPKDAHWIVALVAVRETEAWMPTDPEALREAAPTRDAVWEVPYEVEKTAEPKAVLRTALGVAARRGTDFGDGGRCHAVMGNSSPSARKTSVFRANARLHSATMRCFSRSSTGTASSSSR
ncbi:hypothetical protein RKD24_001901 [Streptomyces calvus]